MSWHDHAACWDTPTEVFYPDATAHGRPPDWAEARKVCRGCPVTAECLQDALDHEDMHGMWGGLTPAERAIRQGVGKCGTPEGPAWHRAHGQAMCEACAEIRAKQRALHCAVEGCEREHYGKGYCETHYKRWVRRGRPAGLKWSREMKDSA